MPRAPGRSSGALRAVDQVHFAATVPGGRENGKAVRQGPRVEHAGDGAWLWVRCGVCRTSTPTSLQMTEWLMSVCTTAPREISPGRVEYMRRHAVASFCVRCACGGAHGVRSNPEDFIPLYVENKNHLMVRVPLHAAGHEVDHSLRMLPEIFVPHRGARATGRDAADLEHPARADAGVARR